MRILLVEDHQIVREGLRALLEREPGFTVVAEAGDGRTAVDLAAREGPDVVVMDVAMPGLNGIDATKQILANAPLTRVIALTMSADKRYVVAMLSAGASGYVLKSAAAQELIRAIHEVAAGNRYLGVAVSGVVIDALVQKPEREPTSGAALSDREREVLQLLAEGRTSKEIATALHVAVSTIETHRRQIMSKLGLRSVAELTKYAVREGLTSVE